MNSELVVPAERMLKLQASYKLFQKLNQALQKKEQGHASPK